MGLLRRVVEGAVGKLDALGERVQAADMAKLTPEQRAHHEQWEARTAALRAGVNEQELGDARLVGKVLQGPAGEVLHGVAEAPAAGEAIEDPAAWEERRLAEHAARDAARAAYLAPGRHPVRFTRIATPGAAQIAEVGARLAASGLAARPDLVYGAYRVPDLIGAPRLGGEQRGIVEWDIVHAADGPLAPAGAPAAVFLDAGDVLVARAAGQPRPLDEDVALDVLARAGVGPGGTLAVARAVGIRHRDGDGEAATSRLEATVDGVHVLVPAGASATAVQGAATGAPWRIPEGPAAGVHVEVLQWDAIAQAVHPVRQRRAPLPSPFAYLPLTPQELLQAYLEIVGVAPADAYAAQVTHDRPFDLLGRSSARTGVRRTGGGPDLPCADGTPRKRMAGGHHIVVAYRDAPGYGEGRARFDAYAETELRAHLRAGLRLRAPVPQQQRRSLRALERVADAAVLLGDGAGTEDGFVAPRYCWPPSDGSRTT